MTSTVHPWRLCRQRGRQRGRQLGRLLGSLSLVATAYLGASAALADIAGALAAPVRGPGAAPFDAALGLAATSAAWLVLTWLTVATVLTTAGAALSASTPGRARLSRLAERVSPDLVRRLAAAALGATLAGGPIAGAGPAHADRTARPPAAPASTTSTQAKVVEVAEVAEVAEVGDPLPGWTPDRPVDPRGESAAPAQVHPVTSAPPAARTGTDVVVVRRGDTLWAIAARHLRPGAGPAEVAAQWPRWHRVNRKVIGPRPDHILPGQRLRPPR